MKLIQRDENIENLSKKKVILFIHIPKTAGTSFHTIMRNIFGDERVLRIINPHAEIENASLDLMKSDLSVFSCITGHIPRYIFNEYEHKIQFFTMLRDPVDRVFSLYRFLSRAHTKDLAEVGLLPGFTFGEFLSTRAPGTFAQVNNGMSRMLSRKKSLNNPDDSEFWNSNTMINELEYVFKFLEQTDFGLVEYMNETLNLIKISWNIPYAIEEYSENSTSFDDKIRTMENIHRIVELNTVDIALYQEARKIFKERVKVCGSSNGSITEQAVWRGTLGIDATIHEIAGRQGFYPTEDYNFSWLMLNSTPKINFFYPSETIGETFYLKLRVYVITSLYRLNSVIIKINNNIKSFYINDIDGNWCTITVKELSFSVGIQELTIEMPYAIPVHVIEPHSMDERCLGVALATVGFHHCPG